MSWKGIIAPEVNPVFPNLQRIGDQLEVLMRTRTKVCNMAGLKEDLTPMKSGHAAAFSIEELQDLLMPIKIKENALETDLLVAYKREVPRPIQEFVAGTKGVGDKSVSFAKFLSRLGHPVHAVPLYVVRAQVEGDDDPRGFQDLEPGEPFDRKVSQLWQYCAIGRPGAIPKGATQKTVLSYGKPVLKVHLHRIVTGFGSKVPIPAYEDLYYEEVEKAVALGYDETKSPASKHSMHTLNHGFRMVKKQFLKDLWIAGRDTCGC
jgi:hypothetical protein